jgi:hypothetical protein
MNAETALALVETKLDQVTAAHNDLIETLDRVRALDLSEDQEDRLMLALIKFGRHLTKSMPSE